MSGLFLLSTYNSARLEAGVAAVGEFKLTDPVGNILLVAAVASILSLASAPAAEIILSTNTLPGTGVPVGGAVGQVLTKVSLADYDATWQTPTGGGGGGGGVTAHNALTGLAIGDDHPQYLNQARGDVRYDLAFAATNAVAAHAGAGDPHPQYLTSAEGNSAYDASGAATSAVAAHAAAGDPHPQYLTPAEGAAAYDPLGAAAAVTKVSLGLGNVDNTSDVNKPVSAAMTAALGLKANLASPTFTGTVGGVTSAMVGLGNVDNTSDVNKPVSAAMTAALAVKEPVIVAGTAAQYWRGDKTWQAFPAGGSQEVFVQSSRPAGLGPWLWWVKEPDGSVSNLIIADGT